MSSYLRAVFERYDLSAADFAVIACLRRAGAPYRLPQNALMERLGRTSGTISVRIDRLVRKGVVTREPDPEDAHGVHIALTDHGLELFDAAAPVHLANEDRMLSAPGGRGVATHPSERGRNPTRFASVMVADRAAPERRVPA